MRNERTDKKAAGETRPQFIPIQALIGGLVFCAIVALIAWPMQIVGLLALFFFIRLLLTPSGTLAGLMIFRRFTRR